MKNLYAMNSLHKVRNSNGCFTYLRICADPRQTQLTVAELKEWAKKKRLRVDSKKKPELIALVEEYFEKI
jgi:hypothetical protein